MNDPKLQAGYKQSANMLFGSQFLQEVYADEDKSMSRVSNEIRAKEHERIQNEKFSEIVKHYNKPWSS